MVVHRSFQGKGIGRKLTRACLREASWSDILMLSVMRSNMRARRIYKSENFSTLHHGRLSVYMLHNHGLGRLLKVPIVMLLILRGLLTGDR